jgi:hypothetical protein
MHKCCLSICDANNPIIGLVFIIDPQSNSVEVGNVYPYIVRFLVVFYLELGLSFYSGTKPVLGGDSSALSVVGYVELALSILCGVILNLIMDLNHRADRNQVNN